MKFLTIFLVIFVAYAFSLQGLYWYYPLSTRNLVKATIVQVENKTDTKIEEVSYNVEKHFAKQESLIYSY